MDHDPGADPAGIVIEALSREDGKNATIRVYRDRIEWIKEESISSLPRSKDEPPVIPLRSVAWVKARKDGPLFSKVLLRTEAGTHVFRMHSPQAVQVRDAIAELLAAGPPALAEPTIPAPAGQEALAEATIPAPAGQEAVAEASIPAPAGQEAPPVPAKQEAPSAAPAEVASLRAPAGSTAAPAEEASPRAQGASSAAPAEVAAPLAPAESTAAPAEAASPLAPAGSTAAPAEVPSPVAQGASSAAPAEVAAPLAPAAPEAPAPTDGDLRQLEWLRDEGMLSAEQFETAKARLAQA